MISTAGDTWKWQPWRLVNVEVPASEPSTVLRCRRKRNGKQKHTFSRKRVARSADHERKRLLSKVNNVFLSIVISRRKRNGKQKHTFSRKYVARSTDDERKRPLNKVNTIFFLSIAISERKQQNKQKEIKSGTNLIIAVYSPDRKSERIHAHKSHLKYRA